MSYVLGSVNDALNHYILRTFSPSRGNFRIVSQLEQPPIFTSDKISFLQFNDNFSVSGTNGGALYTQYNPFSDTNGDSDTRSISGWDNLPFKGISSSQSYTINRYISCTAMETTRYSSKNLAIFVDIAKQKDISGLSVYEVNLVKGGITNYYGSAKGIWNVPDYAIPITTIPTDYVALFSNSSFNTNTVLYGSEFDEGPRGALYDVDICVKGTGVKYIYPPYYKGDWNNLSMGVDVPQEQSNVYYSIKNMFTANLYRNFNIQMQLIAYFGIFIKKPIYGGRYTDDTYILIHKDDLNRLYTSLFGIPVYYTEEEAATTKYDPLNPPDPENPLDPGGSSTTGGGDGSFDDTSDPIDFAPLPPLTAINSGFVGLYAPTLSQLQGLSNYLWNENFNLDQLKKLFADPMDLLISLTIVPLSPPVTVQENIKVGFISTGLPMNKVEQQFITYDFGALEIKPYFDSALDYSPFTKISIYLPYIGLRQLNVDEIMGKTIHLQYNIDLFTGSCVAEIKVADSVLYIFNGNLASSIPLTAGNYSNFLSATMNVAANIGLAVATGGATGATSIASSAANLIASAKPNVEHTGSISSTTGYLSNKLPYLVYEIPRQSLPYKYQDYVGYPSNITSKLSDLSGYTEIESIHLENIPATMNELTEIESLLKQGVIL